MTDPLNVDIETCHFPATEIAKAVVENEKCKIKFTKVAPSSAQVSQDVWLNYFMILSLPLIYLKDKQS